MGAITTELVAAAMAAVPRHVFVPEQPVQHAYEANRSLVIKRDSAGRTMSCLSAAHIQAVMLEQAEVRPGMRVLEVGSGGYNAAVLQELVGPTGRVASVDIDSEIVERARDRLHAAGYDQVEVVLADAEFGVPAGRPWDLILVTAATWDIPPAWLEQLAEAGRIVVPLRIRGMTRSIAFDRDGAGGLVSRSYRLAKFVPMQGAGAQREHVVKVADGVMLRVEADQIHQVEVAALSEALGSPRLERWAAATFDLPDELELYLATATPHMGMLQVDQALVDRGQFAPSAVRGVPVLLSDGSFAYRTKRPNEEFDGFESGVFAHGPSRVAVAERYVEMLRRWARLHRRRGAARIRYFPRGTELPNPAPQCLPTRPHGVVAVEWS